MKMKKEEKRKTYFSSFFFFFISDCVGLWEKKKVKVPRQRKNGGDLHAI